MRCRRSISRCGLRSASAPAAPAPAVDTFDRDPGLRSAASAGSGGDGMIAKRCTTRHRATGRSKMQWRTPTTCAATSTTCAHARRARPRHRHHDRRHQGWSADVAIAMGRSSSPTILLLEERSADDFGRYRRVRKHCRSASSRRDPFTRFDLRPFFENPVAFRYCSRPHARWFHDLRKIAVVADTGA